MKEFLQKNFFNNTVSDYLLVIAGMAVAWVLLQLFKKYIIRFFLRLASKTKHDFDEVLVVSCGKYLIPFFYLLINYSLLNSLNHTEKIQKVLDIAILTITVYYIVKFITSVIEGILRAYMKMKQEPEERMGQLGGVMMVAKAIIWVIGLLMLFSNLGYDVTTIVAGLGVGGIAIALAAQNILGDLFSYFVIFFDKPFEVGDFIVVGNEKGSVEHIGIKTSHIRSINGEQMIMPNAELVKKTIHNFKRLEKRRMLFSIGVLYQTPVDKLSEIPVLLKQSVELQAATEFVRSHLCGFGDFSINFETVYFVLSDDYNVFMETHQQVCLSIAKAFAEKGIQFAYPTQTLFVQK